MNVQVLLELRHRQAAGKPLPANREQVDAVTMLPACAENEVHGCLLRNRRLDGDAEENEDCQTHQHVADCPACE